MISHDQCSCNKSELICGECINMHQFIKILGSCFLIMKNVSNNDGTLKCKSRDKKYKCSHQPEMTIPYQLSK